MEDVRWPAEQLEEHRLEISNRIRNLFWTVSGDYDMEFEPDTEKYVYSKQTVLYEAVKQGAFARYFDQKKLGMYLMKKLHFSAGEDMLLPLAGLCMDAAVNRFIIRERLGTKEIREQAFRELEKAEEEQVSDKAGTDLIHRIRLLYIRHVLENTDDEGMDPQAEIALYKILSLKDAENTEEVINVMPFVELLSATPCIRRFGRGTGNTKEKYPLTTSQTRSTTHSAQKMNISMHWSRRKNTC